MISPYLISEVYHPFGDVFNDTVKKTFFLESRQAHKKVSFSNEKQAETKEVYDVYDQDRVKLSWEINICIVKW